MTTLFHSDIECSAVTVIIILAPSITDTINSVVDLLAVLDCFVMCFFLLELFTSCTTLTVWKKSLKRELLMHFQ